MTLKRPLIALILAPLLIALLGAVGCALVTQPGVKPIPSLPPVVDPAGLEHTVRELAIRMHPRSHDQRENLDRAVAYLLAEFAAAGARTEVQDVAADGGTYHNVIAHFGPAAGPLIVIGAHYDTAGETPGADDNASGVAGLVALAGMLAGQPPAKPVDLVAYTLEEPPYFHTESMGSFQHAQALVAARREVRLMISLEMIGYFRDDPGSQSFPVHALAPLYPDRGNFVAVVGRFGDFGAIRRVKALMRGATDLPVESINAPRSVTGVDFSDHASYWRFGMPAVMVTDTAFFRNPNYHAAGDTPDTLDYARMAKVVAGVYAVAQNY
jgi:Zn-dependent M28 family amino/carboxypeptidase